MVARMKMFLHHTQRIGGWHVPAGKAAEARASLFMQILQRQGIQMCGIAHNNSRDARMPSAKCGWFVPLCLRPERLAWLYIKPYLHLRRGVAPDFPELSYPPAVPCT